MTLIGFLNNKLSEIPSNLCDNGFKYIIKRGNLCLLTEIKDIKEDIFYSSYKGIHLVISGCLLNIDNVKINSTHLKTRPREVAETLIEGYLLKEINFFSRLDGSYIIVLWDENKKRLYINRDIYGTKLLYYYFSPENGFVFSNNLDTLLKTKGQKSISHKALHEYLRFLDISPPYTIYEDINFLEPEKVLIVKEKEFSLKNISNQPLTKDYKDMSLTNAIEEFKNLLDKSIDMRIKDANKVGIFLSGGIDSALICALASRHNKNIKAYTVGFEYPIYDNSEIAQIIANHLGVEHHVFKFDIKEDYKAFNDFVSNIPSPFADPAVIPTFQCFKRITQSVDMILDGTGADTLIGIMPARHIRFILKYSRHIPLEIRVLISGLLKKTRKLSSYSELFDFIEPEELLIRWKGWTKEEISLLCNERCDLLHTRFYKLFSENSKKEPYELYSILMGALPDDRIHQSASLFGLNVSFPYFDRNIQEFIKRLPMKYKYNNGVSKVLFKKLLQRLIPEHIWDQPKQGFNYPFEKLLMYDDYRLPKLFLSKDAINDSKLFEFAMVENYLRRFLSGDNAVRFKIWALVVFQGWYFNYYKRL